MSSRILPAGVVLVAAALVGGGLFLALGGEPASDAEHVSTATRPPVTAAPPATAAIDTVAPSTTVLLVSSDDDGLFPVPNVVGQSRAVAESRLEAFDVEIDVVISTEVADFDEVTVQTPDPGERLAQGATVEIVFSERPRPTTMAADPLDPTLFDSVDPGNLEAGACGVFSIEERQLLYDPIDCDEPHDLQILERRQLEDGPEEFDAAAVNRLLRRQCAPSFLDFVGVSEVDSDALRLSVIRPNEERYLTEGERDSLCVLYPRTGLRIVGSAQDTLW